MSRTFAGFSSIACTLTLVLSGCTDSQTLAEPDPTEGIPTGMVQGLMPPNDAGLSGGDEETPPPIVMPPFDDIPADRNYGPEGDSGIDVGAHRYPLNAALGDIWGVASNHFNVNFTLTDGKFTITPTTIDGVTHNLLTPVKASGVFHADMYSPGDAFSFETYSYALPAANRESLAGIAFFDNAYVGVDVDDSGEVDEDEKQIVIGGTVEFAGAVPDIELNFSVTLSDGQLAEGRYTGLFDFTKR